MAKKAIRRRRFFSKPIHRKKAGFTLPVAVVAGFAPGVMRLATVVKNGGGIEQVGTIAAVQYLGYDTINGKMNLQSMKFGTLPILLGMLVHKFVGGTMGVNRMMAKAGIPVIRL